MTDPATRCRRPRRRLAVAAAGGVLAVAAIVGLAWYVGFGFLADAPPPTTSAPETATGSTSGPAEEGAPMSVHAAPEPVPELRFEDGDGRPVTLADFSGKVVLLNVWATWCGPCREEMPTLDRLQATLGGKDFEVVALSIDRAGIGVVNEFYDEIGIEHLARYIDDSGKAARDLGAVGLPTTLLIDRQGREIARHVGPAEWDTPDMVAFLRNYGRLGAGTSKTGAMPATGRQTAERTAPEAASSAVLLPARAARPSSDPFVPVTPIERSSR